MRKQIAGTASYFLAITLLLSLSACNSQQEYSTVYYDVFDTVTIVTGYAASQSEFDGWADAAYNELLRLHKLYDIYHDYAGISNLKTINDNAGIAPVEVDHAIIELLQFGKLAYTETDGAVNIAMGNVLRLWHDYRSRGIENPAAAELPPMELLKKAAENSTIQSLIIDPDAGTVYLSDPETQLDVGALAKGYAAGLAAKQAQAAGLSSGYISAGGNVVTIGKPQTDRDFWRIGITNPDAPDSSDYFDVLEVSDTAVVTSGDYQRTYSVGGTGYHHIIDPVSLMPTTSFRAVTVVHPDSGTADMLSTALFILPIETGQSLAREYGAEALWILPDGSVERTEGYSALSVNYR